MRQTEASIASNQRFASLGAPSIKPSYAYIYTKGGLSDLFANLNFSALSLSGLNSLTLKGGSVFEIWINLS